jgi:hypothetical protein
LLGGETGLAVFEVGEILWASLMVSGFFIKAEKAFEDSSDSGMTSASKELKVEAYSK